MEEQMRFEGSRKVNIDSAFVIDGDELPLPPELHRLVREARLRQRLEVEAPSPPGRVRRIAIGVIRLYQRHVSGRLPRRCLLEPSCSRYAELAIAHNGVVRGCRETRQRLHRCRSENEGTIDYPKGVRVCLTK